MMQLSEKLAKLRKEKGLSQLEVAEMVDVSRQAVSKWEVGTAIPSKEKLTYLCRLYDVPLEYLLRDDVSEPTPSPGPERGAASSDRWKMATAVLLVVIAVLVIALFVVTRPKEMVKDIGDLKTDPAEIG